MVDDDDDLRHSLRALLESFEYRVIMADSADSAIAAVERETPDLVLTDIYMPGSDGFELINALRRQDPGLPVIAMSGGGIRGNYDNLSIAAHLGASAVIDKPFSNASLVETIERVLQDRQPR